MKFFSTTSDNHIPENRHAQESPKQDSHAETIYRQISAWQQSLLDLSLSNPMLNHRETKHDTLRLLEPGFTELFQRVYVKEECLTFHQALEEDAGSGAFATQSPKIPDSPIAEHEGDIKTADSFLESQKTLQNLKAKAKLARDEQGLNILYLSFGFLEWSDAGNPQDQRQQAPLILVPVMLEQAAIGKFFTLTGLEDELVVNPTLQYKYATTYGEKLPNLDPEKPDLHAFMQAMESLADMRGFRLTSDVSLGLMSCAKIAMYHDLSNNRARILANPIIRAMSGETSELKDLPPQYRNFDYDSVPSRERWQIVNADAGQQEAITLAKAGVSFVLQGPPGTGKSQTIVNIIAEALAQGQKVLFVAEKTAALQTVHKRLAANGLADFCLSLHNPKVSKREIRDFIAANLYLPHHRVNESVLEELDPLLGLSDELNRYALELHAEIAPLNLSIYSAYGYLAKHAAIPEIEFEVESPAEITSEVFHTMLYSVSDLAESLKRLDGPASINPWSKTKLTSPDQTMRNRIIETTHGLDTKLMRILELLREIDHRFDLATSSNWHDTLALLKIMTTIAETQLFPAVWLERKRREELKSAITETQKVHAEYIALYQDFLSDFKPEALEFDFGAWLKRLQQTLQDLKNMEVNLGSNPALEIFAGRKLALPAKEVLESLQRIYHDYVHVAGSLGLSLGDNFADMQELCDTIHAMLNAPSLKHEWFERAFASRCSAMLDCAQKRRRSIAELIGELDLSWEPEIYNFSYKDMLRRFKADYNGFFKFANKSYRKDKRAVQAMAKIVLKKLSDETIVKLLQTLRTLDDEKRLLKSGIDELEAFLGPDVFKGEKDLDILEQNFKTVEKLQAVYGGQAPEPVIRVVCAKADFGPTYARLAELSQTLSTDCILKAKANVQALFGAKCAASGLQACIMPMLQQLLRHIATLDDLHAEIMNLNAREIVPAKLLSLAVAAQKLKQMRQHRAETEAELKHSLQHLYQGPATDWDASAAELERIDSLMLLLEESRCESVFMRNLCDNMDDRQILSGMAQNLCEALNDALPELTVFTGLFYDGAEMENWDLAAVAQRFVRCMHNFEQLEKLLAYHDAQRNCVQQGLGEFVMQVDALDEHPDICGAFQKGFYRQWLDAVLESREAVFSFKRSRHEACLQRFCRLDQKQLEIAKYRIRDKVTGELPFRNGFVTANDEMRILKREMDKNQHILPVQRLFNSIPNLLLQLKPCLMMSPLAVSAYLEADSYRFDLVIFDEASQILPHNAIGAIWRGGQVIIVGDSQQLPPVSFPNINTAESETESLDDGESARVCASLLDEAAAFLPQLKLNRHYRSRHEHLIAFSNHEIYRNKLISFPAPAEKSPHSGVELIYLPNGAYAYADRNGNEVEAEKCVELLQEHLGLHPQRSLGIITFSENQQRAIRCKVRKFREENPQHETFFAEDQEEPFFIKNVEYVQGDERDTIICSLGYGKDKDGKIHLNFGPLNHLVGERCLNVAVSRAKDNVKLVSSILSQDIDMEHTQAPGVQLLHTYLDFAQNGLKALQPLPDLNSNTLRDDFATAVAAFLTAKGYSIQTNVGCSAYKIDIAIQHPLDSKRFVAAVECDGLTYIAARTARDRDHLRPAVLTAMGWQLYRIWSTEWFANFGIESARLTSFIDGVLETARLAAESASDLGNEPVTVTSGSEILAAVAETDETRFAGVPEADFVPLMEISLKDDFAIEDEMAAVLKSLTEGSADKTPSAPFEETTTIEATASIASNTATTDENNLLKPLNITNSFEEYVTETEIAISALTERETEEILSEDAVITRLDNTAVAILSKSGDLTELPQAYVNFLADAALTPKSEAKAVPVFTAANTTDITDDTVLANLTPVETADTDNSKQISTQAAPDMANAFTNEAFSPNLPDKTAPAASTAQVPDNPYGFESYQEADWSRAQLSAHGDKLSHLGEQILYVLQVEQPLHKELLYRRLVGAFNNRKVTTLVRHNVEKALDAKIADRVKIDADGFVYLSVETEVKARVPDTGLNRRAPEHIAKCEIAAAVPVIIQKAGGLKKNALKGELAAVFGYGHRNNKLNHNIDEVLAEMLAGGDLVKSAESVLEFRPICQGDTINTE